MAVNVLCLLSSPFLKHSLLKISFHRVIENKNLKFYLARQGILAILHCESLSYNFVKLVLEWQEVVMVQKARTARSKLVVGSNSLCRALTTDLFHYPVVF